MITKTSTSYAPWHLVASNDKRHARLAVLRIVCDRFEKALDELKGKEKKGRKGQ